MPAGVPRSIVVTCDNSAHCDSIIHKTSVGKISKDAMETKLDWKWVKVQFSAAKSVKKFIGQVMNYISGSIYVLYIVLSMFVSALQTTPVIRFRLASTTMCAHPPLPWEYSSQAPFKVHTMMNYIRILPGTHFTPWQGEACRLKHPAQRQCAGLNPRPSHPKPSNMTIRLRHLYCREYDR